MNDIPLSVLFSALGVLLLLSGFFSGSETALMTLNRYRLKHLADGGHKGALRAARLLQRPDRLIGLILLGNNFVNILASSLSTVTSPTDVCTSTVPVAPATSMSPTAVSAVTAIALGTSSVNDTCHLVPPSS